MELIHAAKNGLPNDRLCEVAPTVNDEFFCGRDLSSKREVDAQMDSALNCRPYHEIGQGGQRTL